MFQDVVRVLIETYWNVNLSRSRSGIHSLCVLIETYWNVNKNTELLAQKQELRINRNILECKYVFGPHWFLFAIVLIETYWNVNLYPARPQSVPASY